MFSTMERYHQYIGDVQYPAFFTFRTAGEVSRYMCGDVQYSHIFHDIPHGTQGIFHGI